MSPLSRREVISAALTASVTASALKRVSAQRASPVPESTPVPAPPGVEITPETVRFDEPFDVFVGGLDPFEQVTVHSSFDDGVGNTWKAAVDVAANATGFPNVSGELPSDGTVPVADAMGLVWGALSGTAWVYTPHVDSEEIVTITCERASGPLTATVRRTFGDVLPTPVDLNEPAGLIGRYYPPAAGRTAPAIVQIGGSEGGLSDYMTPAARLLNLDGYAVLTLAYWGIDHLPSTMSRIPLEYFGAAIAWLQAQEGVDPEQIGMVGTSRGGEGALLVASHYPEIGSVVSISGSGLVLPDPWSTDVISAWTWQGMDMPHVPVDARADDDLRVGEIAVERINGPILLLSGEDDELWPSVYLSQFAWDRLEREGHDFADQFLRYPGCGHAFVTPFQPIQPNLRPFGNGLMMGGTLVGSANAARSSWAAIRQHLASSLTS